jgi:prephenate dehydratase
MKIQKIGIQWDIGSYNYIAIQDYLSKTGIEAEIIPLYTTEWVLQALQNEIIDMGQFALANSTGGLVDETIRVLGHYHWEYVAHYAIKVEHCILASIGSRLEDISVIMAHEQALRQCSSNLLKFYPEKSLQSGEEEWSDNARIARGIAHGELPENIACLGHHSLAELYGLQILAEWLQDRIDNETTFVLVQPLTSISIG